MGNSEVSVITTIASADALVPSNQSPIIYQLKILKQ
jgi:hypothetical protein